MFMFLESFSWPVKVENIECLCYVIVCNNFCNIRINESTARHIIYKNINIRSIAKLSLYITEQLYEFASLSMVNDRFKLIIFLWLKILYCILFIYYSVLGLKHFTRSWNIELFSFICLHCLIITKRPLNLENNYLINFQSTITITMSY